MNVLNLTDRTRHVRIFFHYDFLFWEVGRGDTIQYHPVHKDVVAYKDDCYFLMNAALQDTVGIWAWTTGIKNEREEGGSWFDAEDGLLEGNSASFGSVDGVIAIEQPSLGAGQLMVAYTWLAAGRNLADVRFLDYLVRKERPRYFVNRTINYWQAWVNKEGASFGNLPDHLHRLYRRSLLTLRTQIDEGGGIIAANDSDLSFLVHGKET